MQREHVSLASALCMAGALCVFAQAPGVLHYQGRLVDGSNLANGVAHLSLRIFDAPSAGTLLCEDSNAVPVVDGLYSTFLGDDIVAGSLTAATALTGTWIEVAVDGQALSPREKIASVAYAQRVLGVQVGTNGSVTLQPGVNSAGAPWAVVAGGTNNMATGFAACIGGGASNLASGPFSVVGGGSRNKAQGDSATLIGGRFSEARGDASIAGGEGCVATAYAIALGLDNRTFGYACVISGGDDNVITNTEYASISGGQLNRIEGFTEYATIGGGFNNAAGEGARYAAIPGGRDNRVVGEYALAAGRRARADHVGSFVWGDSTDAEVSSTASNQFMARASGGVVFYSSVSTNSGVELAAGSGSWTTLSDRNAKADFAPANSRDVLDRLASLPIATWRYRTQPAGVRHIGPTAQDFHAAFGVGDSPRGITSVDADGVALAAIQGLYDMVRERDEAIAELRDRVGDLESRLAKEPGAAR